ncbi:hypothetical protein BJV77DRAFT_1030025 [Russula vinacea]|nr:hypothetical protein BJV77DRAFT_1030025 [Russula vinacea]
MLLAPLLTTSSMPKCPSQEPKPTQLTSQKPRPVGSVMMKTISRPRSLMTTSSSTRCPNAKDIWHNRTTRFKFTS